MFQESLKQSPQFSNMWYICTRHPTAFTLYRTYMFLQLPRTLHSQCKMNKSLPNSETDRSKTLIYDTCRQLNLNANAFSTEPADYNFNCQATRLLTARPTIRTSVMWSCGVEFFRQLWRGWRSNDHKEECVKRELLSFQNQLGNPQKTKWTRRAITP